MELTTYKTEISLHDTLKKICQLYSEKVTISGKNKVKELLCKSYEVLLKKIDNNYRAVPTEWNDEDILNALYCHISEYAGDERAVQICKKFHTLYENQNTEIYQNYIGPVVKMLYSFALNESTPVKKKNYKRLKKDYWFDTKVISESLYSFKKYLPREDMKFFSLPKIHSSQSDSNLSLHRPFQCAPVLTFDCNFKNGNIKQEKLSFDLDEGFVTPNEEHKERSPCMDKEIRIYTSKPTTAFDWDLKIVGVPPRSDKSWEKLDLVGREKEHPFISRQIHLQHWLSKAPHSINKISKQQLIEDLMSLLIGVPSTTFSFNGETFICKSGVFTDDHTAEDVLTFSKQYIKAAEAFLELKNLAEKNLSDDIITSAFRRAIKKYLYNYQLIIYHIINGRSKNKSYLSGVQSLIEQVIYLKKILVQSEELKGVALLEHLFSNMETSSSEMFYLLTSLFLQPCLYYFRLIDEWIFLGKWHKDLPISSSDFSLIQDKQSWEEAYKPIQSNFLWFIPVHDLAYCGKALSLLTLSKNSKKFLEMLKSDDKPHVNICLNRGELKKLQMECDNFYEKAKLSIHSQKEEKLNLALCAHNSAKIKTQSFEELKKEKMNNEKERKREELNLREEDLIRSAKVKELKKQEEEFDNIRVAKEYEDMLLKEEKREFEKAKEIFSKLKQEVAEEERKELKAEWKFKRHQNNQKRQEFFNDNVLFVGDNLIHFEHGSNESGIDKRPESEQTGDYNKDIMKVSVTSVNLENIKKMPENQDNRRDNEIDPVQGVRKYSELADNRLKVLGSNFIFCEDIPSCTAEKEVQKNDKTTYPSTEVLNCVETTTSTQDGDLKYSELNENRLKVLGSNFIIGNDAPINPSESEDKKNNKNICLSKDLNLVLTSTSKDVDMKYSELTDNRLKVLGSNFIVGNDTPINPSESEDKQNNKNICLSKDLNLVVTSTSKDVDMKYSELTDNRLKVLGSNFIVGNDVPMNSSESDDKPNDKNICLSKDLNLVVTSTSKEYSELADNRLKVLGSNFIVGNDVPMNSSESDDKQNDKNVCLSKGLNHVQTPLTVKDDPMKYSEVVADNQLKTLDSNFIVGNDVSVNSSEREEKQNDKNVCLLIGPNHVETPLTANNDDIKYSELEDNRLKVLGSNFIVGDGDPICTSVKEDKKNYKFYGDSKDDLKYSELEINRMKALHSDFERGNEAALLVYQDEAGKNKQKVLGSHFTLGSDITVKEIVNDITSLETSQTNEGNKAKISKDKVKSSNIEEMAESKELNKNVPQTPLDSESMSEVTSEHIGVNGVSWFQKCNQHLEGVKNLFKANDLINLPEQQLDYYSILRCVPDSLNLVLETQIKLVNEALLEMFLNEFKLLTEASKLKKYFFLDEGFGKRLTCSLCPAIEKEKPLTLLTFGRLRDVLAFASHGDEKLSFIVKETPTAFELTNPQALSCLGLSYKFNWPLNLIFTDIAMSKYNDVFEYMLSLQRVSWHLGQVWLLLKFRSSQMNGHEYNQIQLYRHIMSQFICSLQWYTSTTVLENGWQKFKREVMEATNFQEVYRKHAAYLKEVIFKCFLNEKSSGLMKRMQTLLKYVLIFCQVMRFGEWSVSETGDYRHCNFMKLQNTFSSFLKLARYIVRQIEKLVKINYQDGLVNLYNLLTINSFYLT